MGFLGRIKDGIQKFNLWIVVVVAFGVYITFFSDYNYFCLVFKQENGMSARSYRTAQQT